MTLKDMILKENEIINKTTLVLDDNFLKLIQFIKSKIDMKILKNNINHSSILYLKILEQEKVRELFKKNYKKFNIKFTENEKGKKNELSKQNLFAIHLALINKEETLLQKEWENIVVNDEYNMGADDELNEMIKDMENETYSIQDISGNEIKTKCCCGHDISRKCILKNNDTKLSIVVGIVCVEKTLILNETQKTQLKDVKDKYNKKNNYIKNKKIKKKLISFKEKYYRKCEECGRLEINKNEPNWKKLCLSCYYK